MDYEGLLLEIKDKVALLTLNRPRRMNSLTREVAYTYLPRILRELNSDDNVRAVVITGAGSSFCTGADVVELNKGRENGTLQEILEPGSVPIGIFAMDLYNLEKPVICAINGAVAGGGLAIALLCDIRYASDQALFTAAYASRGVAPDCGASFLLPRLIGTAKAFELMYTGDIISAAEAERIGLVNKVVPHDKLMEEVMGLAGRIAAGAPIAMRMTKRSVHAGIMNNLEQQLFLETYAQKHCFNTQDFGEGLKSFLDKRTPTFKGK